MAERQRLKGKVAIITGGGTGIGKAIALALAGEGADVVLAARRMEPIEEAAAQVRSLGRRALAVSTDVADSAQVNRMVDRTMSEMGRLDILVNNAGLVRGERRKPIWEVSDAEWRLGMDTNLTGAFFCCRAAGRHLVPQRSGKVINVASEIGMRGGRENFMYPCAKSGVIQLTRSLALTWAEHNVQVNAIAPGFIDTRIGTPQAGSMAHGGSFIPIGRLGIPREIAALALFLAADAPGYITGSVFGADGGALAGGFGPTGHVFSVPGAG